MEKRNVSVYKFSKETGIPKERIYKWLQGKGKPKLEDSAAITKWLNLKGMEEVTLYKEKSVRKPKIENKLKGMPVYESAPATLSNIVSYRDEKQDEPDFWLAIPQYRKCNYACRAKGDSMHPIIRNHALVGGREITDLSVIVFGDIYIIHTKNGIETIKYLHPDPDNADGLLLVPYNGNAKTTPIHKSDIQRLYLAEFVLNPL